METAKIERINELYRKSKAEGLTEEEKKEQQILRREYVDAFKEIFVDSLITFQSRRRMDPLQIWVRNMDRKKEIRAKILKMRQALPKEEVREKSLRIMRRIEETETFKNADNLLAYIDFRGEVATGTLIEKAWELGKKVYVPRVAGKEMEFYRIHSFEDLEKGAYGILEPKKECPVYEAGEGQTTLAILPGSVFDEKKNRVGYGGGFYDRYFEKRKDICRIAAAYEMQIVEEIETEEFDLPADYVTTEERFW